MRIVEDTATRLRLQETSGFLPAFLLGAAVVAAIGFSVARVDPRQYVNVALFAAAGVFFRRVSRIELDKSARRCAIWRVDMWRKTSRTLAFDAISDVQVEIMRPDTSSLSHSRLVLKTPDGPAPLTAGFRTGLDAQIAVREAMVEVIFQGRQRPAPLDPAQVLADGGRPFAAAMRA